MALSDIVRSARTNVVVVPRPELAWVAVLGDDRVRFLHAMLSNVVAGVVPGSGNRSVLLDDKGRMVALLHVLVRDAEVLLGTERTRAGEVLETLGRFVIADDVELETRGIATISLLGPDAAGFVENLVGTAPPVGDHAHAHVEWDDRAAVMARLSDLGVPSVELLVDPELEGDVVDTAREAGAVLGDADLVEALRIEAGRPAWGAEIDEQTIPLEAGLDEVLHRTKGCYVGQETIVRVLARGHVNWEVRGLRVDGDETPAKDDRVVGPDGKEVGRVTSALHSPTLGTTIAMARIRHEVAPSGTPLAVRHDDEELPAEVCDLPFVASV